MSIIDILLAEEAPRIKLQAFIDVAAARAAGIDPEALHRTLCADLSLLEAHRNLLHYAHHAPPIGAEALLDRHFETVQAIDAYGSALVRLKPEARERHRPRFPDLVDRGFVLLCDDDDEPLDDDGHPDGAHYVSPRIWTLTRYGSAIERQEAARFRIHPHRGLIASLRMAGGALSERILDALLFSALAGKRGTRLCDDPPGLRVLASRAFLRRFPEYAPETPPDEGGDPQEPGGYATFAMTALPPDPPKECLGATPAQSG